MKEIFTAIILGLLIFAAFALVFAIPTCLLWNWLMPTLFNLPEITYIQTVGLMFLIRFLFDGIKVNSSKD